MIIRVLHTQVVIWLKNSNYSRFGVKFQLLHNLRTAQGWERRAVQWRNDLRVSLQIKPHSVGKGHLVQMPTTYQVLLFRDIHFAWLTGDAQTVVLHPGGIITPICPGISSSSSIYCILPMWDGNICCSASTWLSLLLASWSHRAFLLCFCFVYCANKSVTAHKQTTHTQKCYYISNKLTFYFISWHYLSCGPSQKCVFVLPFFVFFFWLCWACSEL